MSATAIPFLPPDRPSNVCVVTADAASAKALDRAFVAHGQEVRVGFFEQSYQLIAYITKTQRPIDLIIIDPSDADFVYSLALATAVRAIQEGRQLAPCALLFITDPEDIDIRASASGFGVAGVIERAMLVGT